MRDRVVFDSSVWVEIERVNPVILELVSPFVGSNRVALVDAIVAEVLRGVRSQKDYDKLLSSFLDFEVLSVSWFEVASLAFRVSKRGFSPPLIDLYIAQCVINHKRTLITRDNHFLSICSVVPFRCKLV